MNSEEIQKLASKHRRMEAECGEIRKHIDAWTESEEGRQPLVEVTVGLFAHPTSFTVAITQEQYLDLIKGALTGREMGMNLIEEDIRRYANVRV